MMMMIYPLKLFFTKCGPGEGVPGSHPCAKVYRYGFKNVRLQPPKSPKIFGINFPLRENPGVHRKSYIQVTTTDLPLCNDAITVLKIKLRHSVSVITS